MTLNYKPIRNLSITYLCTPFILFLITWVKPAIAIVCILLFFGAFYSLRTESIRNCLNMSINRKMLILIIFAALLWCWTSGIGGFFYQSNDHHYRNAVFHDLVSYNWPVLYKEFNTGLIYYIGIWIVPAAFGKLALRIGLSGTAAWSFANMILLIWCTIGIILLVLLMCTYFKCRTSKGISILIFILVFFSGLDIVGEIWLKGGREFTHIEWWSGHYQFRSMTTGLFWAYNQAIPCWLMTILILQERKVKNFALISGITLFYAPFPVIGVIPYMAARGAMLLYPMLKQKKVKNILVQVFSYNNVFALCIILPALYFYYTCNTSIQAGVRLCWMDYKTEGFGHELFIWCLFFFLEAGIYILFMIKNELRNPLLYVLIITLIFTSVTNVGEPGEVVFRISASMPSLFVLMCFVIKKIFQSMEQKTRSSRSRFSGIVLALVILIGSITPAVEYYRAFTSMKEAGIMFDVADDLKTFRRKDAHHNFVGSDISSSFFYRYIAQ